MRSFNLALFTLLVRDRNESRFGTGNDLSRLSQDIFLLAHVSRDFEEKEIIFCSPAVDASVVTNNIKYEITE